jgi:hypothetical protein
MDRAELTLSGVPATWTRGDEGFVLRIDYRNAPADAGLVVALRRDVSGPQSARLPESGGSLTHLPLPVEHSGTQEVRFEGTAVSAPLDYPEAFPVRTGWHIFYAYLLNHRGPIHTMIQHPGERILAETGPVPIMIEDRDEARPD